MTLSKKKLLVEAVLKDFSESKGSNISAIWLVEEDDLPYVNRSQKYAEKFGVKGMLEAAHIIMLNKHPDK